jgi:hypothetical protein
MSLPSFLPSVPCNRHCVFGCTALTVCTLKSGGWQLQQLMVVVCYHVYAVFVICCCALFACAGVHRIGSWLQGNHASHEHVSHTLPGALPGVRWICISELQHMVCHENPAHTGTSLAERYGNDSNLCNQGLDCIVHKLHGRACNHCVSQCHGLCTRFH